MIHVYDMLAHSNLSMVLAQNNMKIISKAVVLVIQVIQVIYSVHRIYIIKITDVIQIFIFR